MPNYCENILTIRTKELPDIFKKNEGRDELDFEKIIPMPKSEEDNWYHWRTKHWGTKWNASETWIDKQNEQIVISFDTAWAPPIPIVEELSKQYDLTLEWLEEANELGGIKIFKDQKVVEFDVDYDEAYKRWCGCYPIEEVPKEKIYELSTETIKKGLWLIIKQIEGERKKQSK